MYVQFSNSEVSCLIGDVSDLGQVTGEVAKSVFDAFRLYQGAGDGGTRCGFDECVDKSRFVSGVDRRAVCIGNVLRGCGKYDVQTRFGHGCGCGYLSSGRGFVDNGGSVLSSLDNGDCVDGSERGDGRSGGCPGEQQPLGDSSSARSSGIDRDCEVAGSRGPNWERNRRNREEKKNRKIKRQMLGVDWRVRSADQVVRKGFFSECDPKVQKELRESRAKLLITENNRRLIEEEKKIQRADSPQAVVQEMIRVTNMANRLKKQTTDQKIGGWAETVADSLTRSVAESAPSSVPSLESVGYGKSALRSSDGTEDSKVDSKKSLRRVEYEAMIDFVNKKYDSMDFVIQEDYDNEMRNVKLKYSDVAYSVQYLEKKKILQEAALALCEQGFEAQKIDIAFERFDVDFEY